MNQKTQGISFRRRVYFVLEGGSAGGIWGRLVEAFLVALIIANVAAYVMESVPEVRAMKLPFLAFEWVSVTFFTIEYAARLWVMAEDPSLAGRGAWAGRLYGATRPMMVIDFFAFAPAYVTLFVPFIDLRFLRLIRLLRLLKIARYSPALSTLAQVIIEERRALLGTLLLLLSTMTIAAAAMHAAEGEAQPALFGTIPDSMWWAISTLTTVGYGDAVPITALGRVIAGITMIIGLGLLALPVGIVATGFVESIHRRDFVVTFGMLARVPLFHGFDAQTVAELMTLLRAQSVRRGAIISAEGERAAAMYFVLEGEVLVDLPGNKLRFGAGDFFGELALLHEQMRAATITAIVPTRILSLTTDDFEQLLRHHPHLRPGLRKLARARAHEIARAGGISEAEIEAAGSARAE